jgi:WD40 repeat protein
MLSQMFPVRFWITLTVAALSLAPGALAAGHQEIQTAGKPGRLVWFPRFSPDGKWLITAHGSGDENEGGEVRVWEAETGKPKFVIPTERGVRTVAWAPNGKSFVSGDYGGIIKPKLKSTVGGFNDMVFGVAISPDGKWLAAVGWDDQIKFLDLSTVQEKWSWHR